MIESVPGIMSEEATTKTPRLTNRPVEEYRFHAHFGAWVAIIQIASRQDPRGTLPNGKLSQSIGGFCQSLGRISRLPAVLFEEVIPRLIEIGWLEKMGDSADALGDSADALGDSADALGDSPVHRTVQDSTRQDRTEQNKILESSSNLSKPADVYPKVQNGNEWHAFIEAFASTERQNTHADFAACKGLWSKLALPDQLACVAGIKRDVKHQKYSAPEFWPKPKKYLFEREWERQTAPRKTSQKIETLAERIAKL